MKQNNSSSFRIVGPNQSLPFGQIRRKPTTFRPPVRRVRLYQVSQFSLTSIKSCWSCQSKSKSKSKWSPDLKYAQADYRFPFVLLLNKNTKTTLQEELVELFCLKVYLQKADSLSATLHEPSVCHVFPAPSSGRTYPCPRLPQEGQTLFTGHSLRVPASDAFDIGAVSGFAIPGITGDHAILVQKVQILILALSSISGLHFARHAPSLSTRSASQPFSAHVVKT